MEEEIQKLHEEIIPTYFDQANEDGLQYGIDESGMEVINLPEDEVQKWQKSSVLTIKNMLRIWTAKDCREPRY